MKSSELPKVLRVARILRMVKEDAHYVGTALTIVVMFLAAHYSSCLWILLLIDCNPEDESWEPHACPDIITAYTEGLSVGMATMAGSDGWMRFIYATAVVSSESLAPHG